jgi:hypothetical protein
MCYLKIHEIFGTASVLTQLKYEAAYNKYVCPWYHCPLILPVTQYSTNNHVSHKHGHIWQHSVSLSLEKIHSLYISWFSITEVYRKGNVKGPIHSKLNCAVQLCKNCTKNRTDCSLAQHRFPIRFASFLVNSVCLLVRVTVVDNNKAVICCLPATSALMLSSEKKKRKRKMWNKKRHLKRNISCDVHLLNSEWLKMMPSWCRHVNWRNCGIPWVNCAVLCVKDD